MTAPRDSSAPLHLGITGTDTGIGKTIVAAALAARARQLGLRVSAMTPVETPKPCEAVSPIWTTPMS